MNGNDLRTAVDRWTLEVIAERDRLRAEVERLRAKKGESMNRSITYVRGADTDEICYGQPPHDPLTALEYLLSAIDPDGDEDFGGDMRYTCKLIARDTLMHWKAQSPRPAEEVSHGI